MQGYTPPPVPTEPTLTVRAQDTRDKLLRTARAVFEQDGYDTASVSRFVEQADVSRGTFYLYFESKQHIFRTLIMGIRDGLLTLQGDSGMTRDPLGASGHGPEHALERVIRMFIAFYRENARMMAVLEQVATYDEALRGLRLEMRRAVADRAREFIAHLQRAHVVPATVDPRYAATALTGMVDRFMFVWLILGEEFEEEDVVLNLSRLWFQAVGGVVVADGGADVTAT